MVSGSPQHDATVRVIEDAFARFQDDWFLCHILSGHGHTNGLAADLRRNDCNYFLPLTTYKVKNGKTPDGKQAHCLKTKPLFPGYIFLNGDNAKGVAYDSPHSYQIDDVARGMQKQLGSELRTVAMALEVKPDLVPGPLYRKGSLVKISFPHELAGCLGRVNFESPDGFVYINVKLMNTGIPIPVPISCVDAMTEGEEEEFSKLKVSCLSCGRDTRNITGVCDRCK